MRTKNLALFFFVFLSELLIYFIKCSHSEHEIFFDVNLGYIPFPHSMSNESRVPNSSSSPDLPLAPSDQSLNGSGNGQSFPVLDYTLTNISTDPYQFTENQNRLLTQNILMTNRFGMDPFFDYRVSIPFDVSDANLMEFIDKVHLGYPTVFGNTFGEFFDPVTERQRYVRLPVRMISSNEFDDDSEEEEYDDSEEEDDAEEETKSDLMSSSDSSKSLNDSSQDIYRTPENMKRKSQESVCPSAPIFRPRQGTFSNFCFSPDDFSSSDDALRGNCSDDEAPIKRRRLLSRCDKAIMNFDKKIRKETEIARIHTAFPGQDCLFKLIPDFEYYQPLETSHLLAFEVDFNLFLRLLQYCPKYFGPALALSLQYDEDFPKFLNIFYGVKDLLGSPAYFDDHVHKLTISIILNLPVVSQAAFDFFTSSQNAAFFFAHTQSHLHYKGKFSYNLLAVGLASHFKDQLDFSLARALPKSQFNILRSWILDFDYLESINSLYQDGNFARINLSTLPKTFSIFHSEKDYSDALYKLVKSTYDGRSQCLIPVCATNQTILLLVGALLNEDLDMVKTLFEFFDYSQDPDSKIQFRSNYDQLEVQVTRLNVGFCSVKTISEGKVVTRILPLNP